VEDGEFIRLSVSKALRKKGFSVVEASDGSAAMNLIRANTESFDVLLLDVTLPGLSSREVLEETRRIRPDLTVALTSAYDKGNCQCHLRRIGSQALHPETVPT
jgi:two-component system, cell cycle sensor histidine kinase and response regulator CckA